MVRPFDKLFLFMSIVALPNLYYQAEYNVPLMFFFFVVWESPAYRAAVTYLLVLSWLVDLYTLLVAISLTGKN